MSETTRENQAELENNYVRNCLLIPREEGAAMFYASAEPFQIIVPRLDGYAIVPREQYDLLLRDAGRPDGHVSPLPPSAFPLASMEPADAV